MMKSSEIKFLTNMKHPLRVFIVISGILYTIAFLGGLLLSLVASRYEYVPILLIGLAIAPLSIAVDVGIYRRAHVLDDDSKPNHVVRKVLLGLLLLVGLPLVIMSFLMILTAVGTMVFGITPNTTF